MPDAPRTKPPSPAVAQAMAVLRLLGSAGAPLGVTTIARQLGLGPSTAFNLLKTLAADEMVEFDPATKRYALGFGTLDLVRMTLASDLAIPVARPMMEELASRHDAAVGLWRRSGRDRLVLVALAENEATTRIHMAVGQRQPLGAGAAGRAVLSVLDPDRERLAELIGRVRWQNEPGVDEYASQMFRARSNGYATDLGALNSGIFTVAAAISTATPASHCLSMSFFSGTADERGIEAMGRDVATKAADITARLSGPTRI